MRETDDEWQTFLARLDADRVRRVLVGRGANVHPREEIMIPSAERRSTTVKKDVDGRIPTAVPLAAADEILAYQPGDVAGRVSGLMVVAVEDDLVTPTDHAEVLFEAAAAPKKLIMQHNTTHYAAYGQYGDIVIPLIVAWFERHIGGSQGSDVERVEVGL